MLGQFFSLTFCLLVAKNWNNRPRQLKQAHSPLSEQTNRVGVVLLHFRVSFQCPLIPILSRPWSLTGSVPCKIGLVPKTNQGSKCKYSICSSNQGRGRAWACFLAGGLHSNQKWFPFFMGFVFSLFALWMFLLVATVSNCYLGLLFPILTV